MKGGILKIIWVIIAFAVGFYGFKWVSKKFSSKPDIEKVVEK
ncbi:hypothetical protein ACFLRU_00930 [Bacteroidota bacterium]